MVNRLTHDKWMNGENNTTPTSGGNWKWGPVREINMFSIITPSVLLLSALMNRLMAKHVFESIGISWTCG